MKNKGKAQEPLKKKFKHELSSILKNKRPPTREKE